MQGLHIENDTAYSYLVVPMVELLKQGSGPCRRWREKTKTTTRWHPAQDQRRGDKHRAARGGVLTTNVVGLYPYENPT